VAWKEHIHCSTGERAALTDLVSVGLIDTLRMHDQSAGVFSLVGLPGAVFRAQ
jgi:exonuclease III